MGSSDLHFTPQYVALNPSGLIFVGDEHILQGDGWAALSVLSQWHLAAKDPDINKSRRESGCICLANSLHITLKSPCEIFANLLLNLPELTVHSESTERISNTKSGGNTFCFS